MDFFQEVECIWIDCNPYFHYKGNLYRSRDDLPISNYIITYRQGGDIITEKLYKPPVIDLNDFQLNQGMGNKSNSDIYVSVRDLEKSGVIKVKRPSRWEGVPLLSPLGSAYDDPNHAITFRETYWKNCRMYIKQ